MGRPLLEKMVQDAASAEASGVVIVQIQRNGVVVQTLRLPAAGPKRADQVLADLDAQRLIGDLRNGNSEVILENLLSDRQLAAGANYTLVMPNEEQASTSP